MTPTKIYVASSWRNQYQPNVVKALRGLGHEVYDFRNPSETDKGFAWSECDEDWENWTPRQWRSNLDHPVAQKGFKNDFDAMKWADVCVVIMPSGRSAHIEAGWMAGAGKKVYALVIDKCEPDLMYKCFNEILISFEELNDRFQTTF